MFKLRMKSWVVIFGICFAVGVTASTNAHAMANPTLDSQISTCIAAAGYGPGCASGSVSGFTDGADSSCITPILPQDSGGYQCFTCSIYSVSNTGSCVGNPAPGTLIVSGLSAAPFSLAAPAPNSPNYGPGNGGGLGGGGGCHNACCAGGGGGSAGGSNGWASGSIINTDSQTLGESVPLMGTPWSLNYSTARVLGRSLDYTIHVPLTGASIPSNVTGNTVTLDYLGRHEVHTFSSLTTDENYDWVWDGKDSSGNPYLGAVNVQVTIGTSYNDGSTDYPLIFTAPAGNYQAVLMGLGGWTISSHHFYDPLRQILYFGDGTARSVVAQLVTSGTQYMAASGDGSEVYIFDLNGRHLYTENGRTGSTILTFAYDSNHRLSTITDAYSNVTTVQRNTGGNLTGIQSPYGQVTALSNGTDGYLASIVNPNSETWSMTYYTGGELHTFQKPRGQTSTMTFDGNGLLLTDSSSAGNSLTFAISAQDFQAGTLSSTLTTTLGRQTSYSLTQSASGLIRSESDPEGVSHSTHLNYNSSLYTTWSDMTSNEAYSSDARLGSIANFTSSKSISNTESYYTASTSQTLSPSSPSSPFSYTSLDTTVTQNSYAWDDLFTLSTLKDTYTSPVGRKFYSTMDTYGKPASDQLYTYAAMNYAYDSNGRLHTITQSSRTTTFNYFSSGASKGMLSSVQDPLSNATSYTYDNAGRLASTTLPDTRVINYAYDSNGNLTSVTPPSTSAHGTQFNGFDFPSEYDPPTLGSSNVKTTYTWNNDRQLTQTTRPDGNNITFSYDSTAGHLNTMTIPTGTFTYTYNNNLLATAESADSITDTLYYSGNQVIQDALTNSSSSSLGYMTFAYNNDFNETTSTAFPVTGSSVAISFTYDHDTLLTGAGNETLSPDSNSGLLNSVTLGNVKETYTYDSTYAELATMVAKYNTTTNLLNQSFSRDALGRITSKTETITSGSSHTYGYTFDSAKRLTAVTKDASSYSSYTYDNNSNRTSGNVGGVSFSATYDAQDRLSTYNTKTYTYNLNGERTQVVDSSLPSGHQTTTYTYDELGNLKQVITPSQTVTYVMDGLNRRQFKKVGTTIQAQYLYEDQYRIGAILNSSGALTYRFIYGSKPNVPDYMVKSGTKYKLISDPNGSVRLVVNSSTGAVSEEIDYDEFGNVINDTSPGFQPFGFAGGLYDNETKLVHFGARDYDASVGRWLQKDPIGFGGGDTNLYGYVFSDPVNAIDPAGLATCVYDVVHHSMSCVASNGQTYYSNNFVSGQPVAQNNPQANILPNIGPIPPGTYYIGPQLPNSTRRNLTPSSGTNTFGRTSFQTHGCPNSLTCSQGCVASPNIGSFNQFISNDPEPSTMIVQ